MEVAAQELIKAEADEKKARADKYSPEILPYDGPGHPPDASHNRHARRAKSSRLIK